MSRDAVIFCAGELENPASFYHQLPIGKDALIVCADGGYGHAKALGIVPDMILGDFDSWEGDLPQQKIIQYPVKKDATDSFLAAEYCLAQGCDTLWILGGVGSRWDHSMSNFYLLKYLHKRGAVGILRDANNEAFLIASEAILEKREGWYLSLLPFGGDAFGVTVQGVTYPVTEVTYYMEDSLGISNQINKENSQISIEKGLLLAIFSKDKKRN